MTMGDQSIIKVLIVDDHNMVRTGLATLIGGFDDFELVGEAANGREAVELCEQLRPDVVLMDLMMPEMSGSEATEIIRTANEHVQVVALTSFRERKIVQQALKAGAIGYLMKDSTVDELAEAIRAAHVGKPTLAWDVAQTLVGGDSEEAAPASQLTRRELEVLELMAEGMTNRQIAAQLAISRYTVNAHVSNVLSKLSVSSRTQAVAVALQRKLLGRTD